MSGLLARTRHLSMNGASMSVSAITRESMLACSHAVVPTALSGNDLSNRPARRNAADQGGLGHHVAHTDKPLTPRDPSAQPSQRTEPDRPCAGADRHANRA